MLQTWDECGMGGWLRGRVLVEWQGIGPRTEAQFVGGRSLLGQAIGEVSLSDTGRKCR